jgi:hypothetical protein
MVDRVHIEMREVVTRLKTYDRVFASSVRKQIRSAITAAGTDLVSRVRGAALAQGLHQAAAATSIRANFSARSAGVRIVTARRKSPEAGLYEIGNKGGSPGPGTFKNGTGGVIRKRPFFFTTMQRADAATEQKFLDAIDAAVREADTR